MFDRVGPALEAASEAFGPLQWSDGRATVRWGGATFWLRLESANSRADQMLGIWVPLPRPLPIDVWAEDRERYRYHGALPEVRTGDPSFDDRYTIIGTPAEVVREALDEGTRRWFGETFTGWPSLHHAGGCLVSRFGLSTEIEIGTLGRRPITAEGLRTRAEGMIRFAARLGAAYDARYAAIAQTSGRTEADHWHVAQKQVIADDASRRFNRRFVIFGGLALLVLAGLCCFFSVIFAPLIFGDGSLTVTY